MENNLVKIKQEYDVEKFSINAREIWEKLGIRKNFSDWIKQKINNLGLIENVDYVQTAFTLKGEAEGYGNKTFKEYFLTKESWEHVCLTCRSTKKQFADYFIDTEKRFLKVKEEVYDKLVESFKSLSEKVEELEKNKSPYTSGAQTRFVNHTFESLDSINSRMNDADQKINALFSQNNRTLSETVRKNIYNTLTEYSSLANERPIEVWNKFYLTVSEILEINIFKEADYFGIDKIQYIQDYLTMDKQQICLNIANTMIKDFYRSMKQKQDQMKNIDKIFD